MHKHNVVKWLRGKNVLSDETVERDLSILYDIGESAVAKFLSFDLHFNTLATVLLSQLPTSFISMLMPRLLILFEVFFLFSSSLF